MGGSEFGSKIGHHQYCTFVADVSYTLSKLILYLKGSYGATFNATVHIYSVDGSNLPLTSLLQIGTFSNSDLGTSSYAQYSFTDGSIALVSGTRYAIVILTDLPDYINAQYWARTTAVYSGTYGYAEVGTTWVSSSSYSRYFKTYSGTGSSLPPKVTVTDPADEDADVKPHETTVTWEDPGGDIDHYNIYYGTLSGFLSKVGEVQDGEALEFQLRETNWPYYGQRHYFRIDTVNDAGTTTGDEIGFFIEIFKAPLPSGLIYTDGGDGTYTITGTPTGENNMMTIRKLAACARNTFFYEDI